MRARLWWYVFLLVIFVVVAKATGNASTAFHVAEYVGLVVIALVMLALLTQGIRELRARRRRGKPGG